MLGGLFQGEVLFFTVPALLGLPAVHELAEQAGIELPEVLGRLRERPGGAVEPKPDPDRKLPVVETRRS
jgi:hypothetical protein